MRNQADVLADAITLLHEQVTTLLDLAKPGFDPLAALSYQNKMVALVDEFNAIAESRKNATPPQS